MNERMNEQVSGKMLISSDRKLLNINTHKEK